MGQEPFKIVNNICDRCSNGLCIQKVPLFDQMTRADLLEILKMTSHKEFKKGEYLCNEGENSATMFIVNEGGVKLASTNADGKEQIFGILGDGDVFGEYNMLSDFEQYNYSAVALKDTKICLLTKDKMDQILSQYSHISRKIISELSRKLLLTENLAKNLSTVNTDSKVAYILKELAEQYGVKIKNGIALKTPMTREDMANYAGVTRETMSRKLNLFKRAGLIEFSGMKEIVILDMEGLLSLLL